MIYPIAESIENLLMSAVDEETGEVLLTDKELQAKLDELQMEFNDKITELRNEYINLTAEADALKREKMKLSERQKRAESGAERTKRFIAYLLKGDKFQSGAVKISYRRSEEVVCDDEFIEWASEYAPGLLRFADPEPRKQDIKAALKNGTMIEHARLETKNNLVVK